MQRAPRFVRGCLTRTHVTQRHVVSVRASDAALQRLLQARAAASAPVVAFRCSAAEPTAADDLSSSTDDESPAAPVTRAPRPVSFVSEAGRVAITPCRLPRLDNVPKYMTWTMTTENTLVQARKHARRARRSPSGVTLRASQEELQRRLLYADKEGEMIPGTDDSDAEEPVRTNASSEAPVSAHSHLVHSGRRLSGPAHVEPARGLPHSGRRLAACKRVGAVSAMRLTRASAALTLEIDPQDVVDELASLLRLDAPSVGARMNLLLRQVDPAYHSSDDRAAGIDSERAVFTRVHTLLSDPRTECGEAWRAAANDMVRTCAAGLVIGLPERVYPDLDSAIDSFKTLYCRRCHVFDCHLHGCGQLLPEGRRAAANVDPCVPSAPCGPACALEHSIAGPASPAMEQAGWSAMELSLFATASKIHGRNSCRIARVISSRTCLEVREFAWPFAAWLCR